MPRMRLLVLIAVLNGSLAQHLSRAAPFPFDGAGPFQARLAVDGIGLAMPAETGCEGPLCAVRLAVFGTAARLCLRLRAGGCAVKQCT